MNRKNCKKLNFTKWKQQSNHKLTLMKRVFYWCFCFVSRDHHETTFVTLNRLCPLSKARKPPPPPSLGPNGQYQPRWNTNQI